MTNTSKKQLKYKAKLEQLGNTMKAEGNSVLEAIDNLGLIWEDIKLKGNLSITYGKKKAEKLYYLPQLRKLFASRPFRMMQAKHLKSILK
jgi:hypothetical protein